MYRVKLPKPTLSYATENDCRNIWAWRNSLLARKNSFNSRYISWQEHKRWFSSKIKDGRTKIYIAKINKRKIGCIRFEVIRDYVQVSIHLNPIYIGKGFGAVIIKNGTLKFLKETNPTKPIMASIKKDNIASQKVFLKAGYKLKDVAKTKLIYIKDV
jgi:RimJ/RimL family protein N-acetyltransferase